MLSVTVFRLFLYVVKSVTVIVVNTEVVQDKARSDLHANILLIVGSERCLQYAPSIPEFVELTGEQSTGVLYNLIGGPLDTPKWARGQELMQAYRERFGLESGAYGVGLYEMTNLYLQALEEVGDATDHDAIGAAIGRSKQATVAGNIEFDPETHVALQSNDHIPVSFWQIWEGERVLVGPEQYANGDFKLPPWMSGQ